ncbi:MAG: flagellar basal body L-ring protein FlgH [Holophagaceae bacterium]|nr:flagellar basal body L-ring protein FlgH [Holophagaceae bacterium]
MRKILPIVLLLSLGTACSLPQKHNPNLLKSELPWIQEVEASGPLSEGSLWVDRSLFSDLRARSLNDLVTIQISESTNAITQANTTTSKNGNNAYETPILMSRVQTSSNNSAFQGSGTTGRSATFTTTVTARVVKVLNNGNLIFEGTRDIQLNNENQRLYVAGLIDPRMLSTDNIIRSGNVSDLRIGYGGAGVVDEVLKPGVISRLLNFVWPF